MEITKNNIIGDVVAENYKTSSVFEKHDIDFCCQQGRSTIDEACKEKDDSETELIQELNEVLNSKQGESIDFQSWPLDLLIDYIIKKHHRYVEKAISEIKPYLEKISQVHGEHHPELHEIRAIFDKAAGEFAQHIKKEELMLFPQIRKMVKANEDRLPLPEQTFNSIEKQIKTMMEEHDVEGEALRKISKLSGGYKLPEDACNTFRVTYKLLNEFEDDLHQHVHLENNILFPNSLEMGHSMKKEAIK